MIDQDNKRIDIILTEENLSKAIGRRGQNVRLASKLTNFEIDILTDKEDSERRQAEFKDRTETLIKNLEVDETLGQLLVSEGFISIDEIAPSLRWAKANIERASGGMGVSQEPVARENYEEDEAPF